MASMITPVPDFISDWPNQIYTLYIWVNLSLSWLVILTQAGLKLNGFEDLQSYKSKLVPPRNPGGFALISKDLWVRGRPSSHYQMSPVFSLDLSVGCLSLIRYSWLSTKRCHREWHEKLVQRCFVSSQYNKKHLYSLILLFFAPLVYEQINEDYWALWHHFVVLHIFGDRKTSKS